MGALWCVPRRRRPCASETDVDGARHQSAPACRRANPSGAVFGHDTSRSQSARCSSDSASSSVEISSRPVARIAGTPRGNEVRTTSNSLHTRGAHPPTKSSRLHHFLRSMRPRAAESTRAPPLTEVADSAESEAVDGAAGTERDLSPVIHTRVLESRFPIPVGDWETRVMHTIEDFVYVLVPGLQEILRSPSYWGVLDRHEAECILQNQPEGSFLLRDSAHEEHAFAVSFRRYDTTLHARVELSKDGFSFDKQSQAGISAPTVLQLLDHFKDPDNCPFYEPLLTTPLRRRFVHPLSALCRGVVADSVAYCSIPELGLPLSVAEFLRHYRHKERVRVRYYMVMPEDDSGIKVRTQVNATDDYEAIGRLGWRRGVWRLHNQV